MRRLFSNPKLHHLSLLAVQIMPVAVILLLNVSVAYGYVELGNRSITLGSGSPSAVTTYDVNFSITSGETLGSVEVLFCSNSPIMSDSCTVPAGMDASSAVLNSQSGPGDFTLYQSSPNSLILARTPSVVSSQDMTFNFSAITNPNAAGPYYARISTYASNDASGSPNDFGGIALYLNSSVTVNSYVPPYLYFCAGVAIANLNCDDSSGNYINFGYLSTTTTSTSESQLVVATNALNGYTVQVTGNSMTSGNNVIPPLSSSSNAVPGQDQFGLNLVANTRPNVGQDAQGPGTGTPLSTYAQPNLFKYLSGDVLASSSQPSDLREYTVSYIIDINSNQAPGYYATTLTYIGMGNF